MSAPVVNRRVGVPNPPTPLGGRTQRLNNPACREPGVDPEWFFHPHLERGKPKAAREAKAKAVCARCHIREACLAEALTGADIAGTWGGTTQDERRAMLRTRAEVDA